MRWIPRATPALLLAATAASHAQVQFVEVGGQRGFQPYTMAAGMGGGVVAADFDDDGDVDLFVPTEVGVPHQLYRNLGNGQFEEIAAAAGVASLERGRVALWFDYDGDRRLDLFVASDCRDQPDPDCPDLLTLKLYRQVADAQFQDVTLAAGFTDDLVFAGGPQRGGICAGDIDGDGYLDLLIGLWLGEARLFHNGGDGTFTEISATSGIGSTLGHHWQPVMFDFDGDGRQDIFHAMDFVENHLWLNQGDETFTDAAADAGVNNAWFDMGVTLGDYDNDGDLDLYITEIFVNGKHNVLYRNDTVGASLQFVDVSQAAGVDDGGWGWGTTFFDADNDGDLDLATTNGWSAAPFTDDPSKFFLNVGGDPVTFVDMSDASGYNDTLWGSALNALDHDRDGDLDLVQSCNGSGPQPHALLLLDNRLEAAETPHNYLVVKPRMPGPNYRAIGAVVRARIGTLEMMRPITAGTSLYGQEPAEAFFGLGSAASVDELTIEWPDGSVSVQTDVAANQVLTVDVLTLVLEGDELSWSHATMGPEIAYDVARGDLATLLAGGGDFAAATMECLTPIDLEASSMLYTPDPLSGEIFWFLVRPVTASGNGSYDVFSGSQLDPRDAEINSSPSACS